MEKKHKSDIIFERQEFSDKSSYWYALILNGINIGSIKPRMEDDNGERAWIMWEAHPYLDCFGTNSDNGGERKDFKTRQRAIDYIVKDVKTNSAILALRAKLLFIEDALKEIL